MILTLLAACTGSTSSFGTDTLDELDEVRALVDAHVAAVKAADSVEEVAALEDTHAAAVAAAMDDVDGGMSDMMGCSMSDHMDGQMSDAQDHMQEMMDGVAAHGDVQAGQSELAACWDEEDAYQSTMRDHMDAMEDDMDGFDADADCTKDGGMRM